MPAWSPATLTRGKSGTGALTWGSTSWAIRCWQRRAEGLFRFTAAADGFTPAEFNLDVRHGGGTLTVDGVTHDVRGWRVTGAAATFETRAVGGDGFAEEFVAGLGRKVAG